MECGFCFGIPGGSDGKESPSNVRDLGSILGLKAWKPTPVFLSGESPWTEEPGVLQPMGSQRVGHDRVTKRTVSEDNVNLHLPHTLFLMNLVPLGRVLELSFLWTPFFPEFLFLFFFLPFPFFLFLPFFLSFFLLSFLLCFFLKGWDWPDHVKAVGPNVELLETKRP